MAKTIRLLLLISALVAGAQACDCNNNRGDKLIFDSTGLLAESGKAYIIGIYEFVIHESVGLYYCRENGLYLYYWLPQNNMGVRARLVQIRK